jgi:hypothetical protein
MRRNFISIILLPSRKLPFILIIIYYSLVLPPIVAPIVFSINVTSKSWFLCFLRPSLSSVLNDRPTCPGLLACQSFTRVLWLKLIQILTLAQTSIMYSWMNRANSNMPLFSVPDASSCGHKQKQFLEIRYMQIRLPVADIH